MRIPVSFHYAAGPNGPTRIERMPCDYPTYDGAPVAVIRAALLHGATHGACEVAVIVTAFDEITIIPLDEEHGFSEGQMIVLSLLGSPN